MRFEIVRKGCVPVRRVYLRDGWRVNETECQYLYLEKDQFKQELPDGEVIFYIQKVTFVADNADEDWHEAYSYFEQNNPNGCHRVTETFSLTVEAAMGLVFKEVTA